MKMSSFAFALLALSIGSPSGLTSLAAAQPSTDCSYLVAGRTYANTFGGFLNLPAYSNADSNTIGDVPNAGAGRVTFHRKGVFENDETIVIAWLGVVPAHIQGTYTLNWDTSKAPVVCSGAMTGTDADGIAYNFQLLLSQNGDRVEMFHTDTGLIVGATGLPMDPSGCHDSTVAGTYSYNTTGWALWPGFGPDQTLAGYSPGGMSGAMQFIPGLHPSGTFQNPPLPGSGSVNAWDTVSINGKITTRVLNGWYKIHAADCTGTIVLVDDLPGTPEYKLQVYIGKDGNLLYAVNINTLATDNPIPIFAFPIPLIRADARRTEP